MRWLINDQILDTDKAEITGPEGPVSVERLPYDLLLFLLENRDRVVSRDELIAHVWDGRAISDSTLATAVKLARKAVGDNGADQRVIRTLHGRGFRFVAVPREAAAGDKTAPARPAAVRTDQRKPSASVESGQPSIAALRFQFIGPDQRHAGLATAFPTELLASLSRMRWLHVVSRGSSFQFDPQLATPAELSEKLAVKYAVTGLIEMQGDGVLIVVELQSTADGSLIWSDRFSVDLRDIQQARQSIVASVIAALEIEVPQYEAQQRRRMTFEELDAWSHFHLGLSHIYKFKEGHTQKAEAHFRAALDLDPEFGRAHAGLSFTNWQNAFMRFGSDRDSFVDLALASANRALEIDPVDPFSNFNMGRARWLEGDIEGSTAWLERAVRINPNYAQGQYNRGLVSVLAGASGEAADAAGKALSLSPLDPLQYAMISVQSLSRIIEEDFGEAVRLSDQAMQSPDAHFYIALIAACANELNGDRARAERRLHQALRQRPDASTGMFLAALPFSDLRMRQTMMGAFGRLGLS